MYLLAIASIHTINGRNDMIGMMICGMLLLASAMKMVWAKDATQEAYAGIVCVCSAVAFLLFAHNTFDAEKSVSSEAHFYILQKKSKILFYSFLIFIWYLERGSNPHSRRKGILNPSCLPFHHPGIYCQSIIVKKMFLQDLV